MDSPRRLPLVFFLLLFGLLAGCVTKVESLRNDASFELGPREGFLILAVDTNIPLHELHIQGRKKLIFSRRDLRKGTNYLIVPVTSGRYSLSRIYLEKGYWSVYMELESVRPEVWSFDIEPGKINYIGHLEFGNRGQWYLNSISLLNNSSLAQEFLETNFPTILGDYNIHYAGPGEDDFFEIISQKKEAR